MLDESRAGAEITILGQALGGCAQEARGLFGRSERGLGHSQTSVMCRETIITIAMSNTMQCDLVKVKMILAHIISMPHTSNMSEKKNPLGPTGLTVAANIKRLREEQRLTYVELSHTLSELGRPIPTLGLSRIESGQRRVDADDLMALASALGAAPNILLMPGGYDDEETTETTGSAKPVPLKSIYYFLEGMQTLDGRNSLDFAVHSLPDFMQMRRTIGRKQKSWNDPGQTWIYRAIETDGNVVQWRVTESVESVLAREDDDD